VTEPLREIPFSAAPYDVTLSTTDEYGTAYVGDHVIVPTQFGFFRLDAKTGAFVHRAGVVYQLPGQVSGQVGFISGDYHQPVNALVANDRWIVTNNTCPIVGYDRKPAAVVWRNDAEATLHGVVQSVRGYPATFDLRLGVSAHLRGDTLYLFDGSRYAVIDLLLRAWDGWQDALPDGTEQHSIGGFGYRYRIGNDPWANGPTGGYGYREYVALRSDVSVVSEPLPSPAPTPSPTPSPATAPAPSQPQPATPAPPAEPVPTAPGGPAMPLVATWWDLSQGPVPDGFDAGVYDAPNNRVWIVPKGHAPIAAPVPVEGLRVHNGHKVEATYKTDAGASGEGFPIHIAADYALLGFFGPNNPELLTLVGEGDAGQQITKIMDGTGPNVDWTVTVTAPDGRTWTKRKADVTGPGGIVDWNAFPKK
jgi:hypothetical protein